MNLSKIELRSCLFALIPLIFSLFFVYHFVLVSLIFVTFFAGCFLCNRKFVDHSVFIRALFLSFLFIVGYYVALVNPIYRPLGIFTMILSLFHYTEYLSVAMWCSKTLTLDSFLLNHSIEYHLAIICSYIEFIVEIYFCPSWFALPMPMKLIFQAIGLLMIAGGEFLRKLSIYTAKTSFSHLIQSNPARDEHRLITHGIYHVFRHPAYVGWFYWAVGTQIFLCNPVSTIIFLLATWSFFQSRIEYEEMTLLKHYGKEYRHYQESVPVGIPFITGFRR